MYLINKLVGVRIGRMYVPDELAEYTMNIVNFILASPGLQDDKAEFTLEKGEKTMLENGKVNVEEITNPQAETENDDECPFSNMPSEIKDMLNIMALKALIEKSFAVDNMINILDERIKKLENSKCSCRCQNSSENTAA